MFARVFALLPLALLVSASHLKARDTCSTGTINCCNKVQSVDQAHNFLADHNLVAAAVGAVGGVGFGCSPIDVLAIGGNSCSGQTVCCSNDDFNGLVNVGCTPINVGF